MAKVGGQGLRVQVAGEMQEAAKPEVNHWALVTHPPSSTFMDWLWAIDR